MGGINRSSVNYGGELCEMVSWANIFLNEKIEKLKLKTTEKLEEEKPVEQKEPEQKPEKKEEIQPSKKEDKTEDTKEEKK